ncbi:MAG: type I-D CRISPR-associated helicase Cas3' [Chloroflexi bacterium]|nr:type I-D CRISPR-associated helicase Cas3' [Chloroflexota bacterium]MCI0581069.1 type I-D CRISPR-associated helicase Cas3' [Chloroflexota bacterium]MCI0649467.1 type I-D CRISPR-associated helicase Cas3' [Chloroflexota bacterium]MCI0731862.1 type I-D CRISPR-associated helicase Cas3' [Chloroflexota bacterium]
MFKVTTLPVYSKLAQTDSLPVQVRERLPKGWQLSEHQLETYLALTSGEYDVVFNTAMTGDGKSLAAYMPALVNGTPLLAMYPTNELSRDQELQLPAMRSNWQARFDFSRVTAARLEEMVRTAQAGRKALALERVLSNQEVVLTNPDIFHYIAQFYYTRYEDAPDRIFGRRLVEGFDQFIFDEFHIFETPQVVSVVNALLLIREVSRLDRQRKRFLFLSATPGELLTGYLQQAGFELHLVDPTGRYQHTRHAPDAIHWRPIIRETDIFFATQTVEEWMEANLQDVVLPFFRENRPGAKGAIIVNSVATAYRLAGWLKPILGAEGLTVELNTGLTSEELKKASRESDLLIGTSTVDVGVDFHINFLIFESRGAGTFLQRLGRLGRHVDDGRGHSFELFQAHALVPNFVGERLFPVRLADQGEYTREELAAAIRDVYPPPTQFAPYVQEWGRLQCAHVFYSLARPTVKDNYLQVRKNLHSLYWRTFRINVNQAVNDYKALRQDRQLLAKEAQSFRGSSPLQCGVVDQNENGRSQIKRYNLLTLAANANLAWLERDEYAALVRQLFDGLLPFPVEELAGWFHFYGFASERRKILFRVNHPISTWSAEELGTPQILSRIRLDVDGVDWLNPLNRHLERRNFVVTLCLTPPHELRYRLRLPPLFELYEFQSPVDSSSGAIAFARQALLLHVALQSGRFDCGGGAMIV